MARVSYFMNPEQPYAGKGLLNAHLRQGDSSCEQK